MRGFVPIFIIMVSFVACAPVMRFDPTTATAAPSLAPTPGVSTTFRPPETLTSAPTITATPTFTPEPTFVVLRGVVNQEHVNCYYGPSKAYLYKYGLLKGNRLDIIGYLADTGYIKVQAIGGNNPCWTNLEFMDMKENIETVKPVDPLTINLPWSPYYPALSYAKAIRSGDEVTITWALLNLRGGDDSEQEPYLLETWVCRDGKLTFVPIGTYSNNAMVVDEPGCSELSFGRVYGVEKHGYTKYLKFQWPQAEEQIK